MNQSFIDSLMHFFSLLLLPLPGRKIFNIRLKLEEYIIRAGIGFPREECLNIYYKYSEKYFFEFSNNPYLSLEDIDNIHRHLIFEAGNKSQENLLLQERHLVILSLIEFNLLYYNKDEKSFENIKLLSKSINISSDEFDLLLDFLYKTQEEESDIDLILSEFNETDELEGEWADQNLPSNRPIIKEIEERVKGRLHFRFFQKFHYVAFIYTGKDVLHFNKIRVYPGYFYSIHRKDKLCFENMKEIDCEEIESYFKSSNVLPKIVISGKDLSYRYSKTNYSIKPFSFREESGQLIALLGNNGVGKSTILKLISNQLNPSSGTLYINGSDIRSNYYKLNSVIAFVADKEFFFPELTVYENLIYHAHLTLGNLTRKEIENRVRKVLKKLGLEGIKDIKTDNKPGLNITDYQRICIKIALELIRNPYIIFLDEVLTGLSFSDSKKLISLLREEANQGKLVFLTSQLPTNEIFKLFDKIWLIDQEAYLVYQGEPENSLSFFRNTGLLPHYYIQTDKKNISAEDVINIIESKKIHSEGHLSELRQVSPGAWYDAWKAELGKHKSEDNENLKPLPIQSSSMPSIEKQFIVYLLRNMRLRLFNMKYVSLLLFGVPGFAAVFAIIIKFFFKGEYSLESNSFLPLFFYMSSVLMLIFGMFSGAEEIFLEKKHLKRDKSINISSFAYYNSKLIYLFLISIFQAYSYSLVSNIILELHGLTLKFTLIYFSTLVSGNLLGLLMSSGFDHLKSIYIHIALFSIPLLLFTGYLIPFEKRDEFMSMEKNVPVFADFLSSRWAYEALMVCQYTDNKYNTDFFENDQKIYDSNYLLEKLIPALNEILSECEFYKLEKGYKPRLDSCLQLLKNEFNSISIRETVAPFENIKRINAENYDSQLYDDIYGYLTYLSFVMENNLLEAQVNLKDKLIKFESSQNPYSLEEFKSKHFNKAVSDRVTGIKDSDTVLIKKDIIIKKGSNIYLLLENNFGRAQFFAHKKKFNNDLIPSYRFNLSAIWLLNMLLYVFYLLNMVERFIRLIKK